MNDVACISDGPVDDGLVPDYMVTSSSIGEHACCAPVGGAPHRYLILVGAWRRSFEGW